MYPLAVLIDELRHDDVTVRVNAMGRISTIALAMGEARTRNELIPFLEEAAQEDEDELLVVLADELAKFVPLVGGPEHAHALIDVLASLAGCEEPTVRQAAVASLNDIAKEMTPGQVSEHFVPLLRRISTADWFSSRMSAAGIYASVFSKLGASDDLLALYKDLVTDDAPMVRRAAATGLPQVVEALGPVELSGAIHDMFESLVYDDQDSVRLLSVDVVVALAESLRSHTQAPVPEELVAQTLALLSDKSWRVRYMAADRLEQLAEALNADDTRPRLVAQFVALCKDGESEVRSAAAKHVVGLAQSVDPAVVLDEIVPAIEPLVTDPNEHVRESLASQISYLSVLLGNDKTIKHLLPLFLQMLKDEHSEVRLQIISNLQVINEVIGIDLLSQSLLPAITELAKDKQWRVLLAIINYSPLLAEQLGVEFFNKELVPLVMQWLWDPVWAIRDAAATNLVKLADVFGVEWLETIILPKLVVPNPTANYLYRFTSLMAVKTLVPSLSRDALQDPVLPFLLSFAEDNVPNIRFNVAKALLLLAQTLVAKSTPNASALVQSSILPVLEKHVEDVDVDVRFYVGDALTQINELVAGGQEMQA